MKTHVQKWGNSLALRIPKSFATEVGLSENCAVNLTVAQNKLVVEPQPGESLSLHKLLAKVTDKNLHGEWDSGPAMGKEIW